MLEGSTAEEKLSPLEKFVFGAQGPPLEALYDDLVLAMQPKDKAFLVTTNSVDMLTSQVSRDGSLEIKENETHRGKSPPLRIKAGGGRNKVPVNSVYFYSFGAGGSTSDGKRLFKHVVNPALRSYEIQRSRERR